MKRISYILLFLSLLTGGRMSAQKLVAQVSKNKVAVGEVFQVAFTLNGPGSNFRSPDFRDFDVYSGPNQSTSMQIINGTVSQSATFSFLIAAKREGKLQIGAASITASNGQKLESTVIPIEAIRTNAQPAQGGGGNPHPQQGTQAPPSNEPDQYTTSSISGDDLFIRTSVSKTKCYIGEQITVTQKIYSRAELRNLQPEPQVFNGFWSQRADGNGQVIVSQENLDGVIYNVAELDKTYLFPQRAGTLTIDPLESQVVIRKSTGQRPRNILEQLFGGGGFQDFQAKIKGKPVTITVQALPEQDKPVNFSGAVGSFNYKAEINKQSVKANEAINLKVTINGRGNIKLVDAVKLNLPESFETYDPKISENINTTGGVNGTRSFDYLIIPREAGSFTLSELNFSYFDPAKKAYVTLPSPEITITVLPGDPGSAQSYGSGKRDVISSENDIRYIKKGDLKLETESTEFFGSALHYLLLILSALGFIVALVLRSRFEKQNSNVAAVNERKAAKLARKQLVNAEKHMQANNKDGFYSEVLTALNNYLSFKLNIPVAELNKENIRQQLSQRQVEEGLIDKLFTTLDSCEYARYAPGAVSGDLKAVYQDTVALITGIENELKA